MKLNEAIAQAKAEGYDYDKQVSHRYQESMSPLELRMVKKLVDDTAQTLLAKGDYDGAVVFSARSKGIQRALDEKAALRSRETS